MHKDDSPGPANIQGGQSSAPSETGAKKETTSGSSANPNDRIVLPDQLSLPAYVQPQTDNTALNLWLDRVQLVLVVILAFLTASFAIRNSDFFLHLATGRAFAQGTYHLGEDPFSYTTQNIKWINHSWLYDWGVFRLFEAIGGTGLVILKAIAVAITAILLLQIRYQGQRMWLAALLAGLAIIAINNRLSFNPIVLSYLFLAATLFLLHRLARMGETSTPLGPFPWPALALPLLVVIWANVDQWFILGPLTIGLFFLGSYLQTFGSSKSAKQETGSGSLLKPLGLAFVGSLLACLVNPYHVRAFELPLEIAPHSSSEVFSTFGKLVLSPWEREYWKDAETGLNIAGLAYYPLFILGLFSFMVNLDRLKWGRLLVWAAFLVGSTLRYRLIPFFAVVSAPVLALNFQDFLNHAPALFNESFLNSFRWQSLGRALSVAGMVLLLIIAWAGGIHSEPTPAGLGPSEAFRVNWSLQEDASLRRAAESLAQARKDKTIREGDNGFILSLDLANYCAWYCPDEKSFMDTRLQLFPKTVVADYVKLQTLITPTLAQLNEQVSRGGGDDEFPRDEKIGEILRKWNINHIVLSGRSVREIVGPLFRMAHTPQEWTLVGLNGRSALFLWNNSKNSEASAQMAKLAFNPDLEAFGPHSRAVPIQPPLPAPAGQGWDEKAADLWESFAYARAARSADSDQAELNAIYGEFLNNRVIEKGYEAFASQAAGAIGYAAAANVPTALLTLTFWHVPQLTKPPINVAMLPGSPLLAIRAARRAIAAKPDDAHAYFTLAYSLLMLPEGASCQDFNSRGYLLASLRRCQAAAALRAAITINPDYFEAHQLFYRYYMSERFFYQGGIRGQRPGSPFADLANENLKRCVEIYRQKNPKDSEGLKALQDEFKRLDDQILKIKSDWTIQSSNPNMHLLDKAILAGNMGLAGIALKTLEQASPTELTDTDTPNSLDLDKDGQRVELDLFLRCGRVSEMKSVFYGEGSKILQDVRPKAMGRILLPSYKWLGVEYNAATGDFAAADALLEEMIKEMHVRQKRDLGMASEVFIGRSSTYLASFPWLMQAMLPSPKPIALVLLERMLKNQVVSTFSNIPPIPREEADVTVVRGVLALEEGDNARAKTLLEAARNLAAPPRFYLRHMSSFGQIHPLTAIVTGTVASHSDAGFAFEFPLQDYCNLYLSPLELFAKGESQSGQTP